MEIPADFRSNVKISFKCTHSKRGGMSCVVSVLSLRGYKGNQAFLPKCNADSCLSQVHVKRSPEGKIKTVRSMEIRGSSFFFVLFHRSLSMPSVPHRRRAPASFFRGYHPQLAQNGNLNVNLLKEGPELRVLCENSTTHSSPQAHFLSNSRCLHTAPKLCPLSYQIRIPSLD